MNETRSSTVSRREALTAAATALAGGAIATDDVEAQEQTVIDMTDDLVFAPDSVTVAPGTTVVWENVGQIPHSVTAYEDEIPEEAEYFASGGFENEQDARSSYPDGEIVGGDSYERTFDVEGEYGYFCIPHEANGMVATLTVAAGGGGGDGGGAAGPPEVTDDALSLAIGLMAALGSVIGLVFFFLKYNVGATEEPE
ncbi:plastocyanin [Salinarchaeum sp. Harcht-Bsk1]|uniref:plastocyanin/azurin family copper-binding protein n=1 Tax=Salinarchaeum sp. Harcht-Bsk1 TaxID=1333523 RepID=UPI00034245D1|nr:plastocyanin/azurin family copper-binding protein [Salinarchaeum sp. Harcht-Bsk1]AGN00677.1 plastocyanin [Salinarchaeum sp. Harcht-Bsk1]